MATSTSTPDVWDLTGIRGWLETGVTGLGVSDLLFNELDPTAASGLDSAIDTNPAVAIASSQIAQPVYQLVQDTDQAAKNALPSSASLLTGGVIIVAILFLVLLVAGKLEAL